MKPRSVFLAGLMALAASTASAATVSITEGKRDTILGSTKIGDAKGSAARAYDAGDFGEGDTLKLHGRMVGAVDAFAFSFGGSQAVEFSFAFGGYATNVGASRASGFVGTGSSENTSVFRLLDANDPSRVIAERTFTSGILSAADNGDSPSIFRVDPGDYIFQIDGSGQGNTGKSAALYDIQISTVPVPASGLLLLAGFGAMAALRRKKRA
ncbi:MAG: VPLPA-CTERM sorting domain-containing protein [Pseudomonadota bacterium]